MNSKDVWLHCTEETLVDIHELDGALRAENLGLYGDPNRSTFGLIVREAGSSDSVPGRLVGGAKGIVHWKWFYLSHLWVHTSRRGHGLGGQILTRLLEDAREQNWSGIYVDTFSSDAVRFYQKAGFDIVGKIPKFINGFDRTYLKISLL
jgi:GNAT superfamily N-acetyltransferase